MRTFSSLLWDRNATVGSWRTKAPQQLNDPTQTHQESKGAYPLFKSFYTDRRKCLILDRLYYDFMLSLQTTQIISLMSFKSSKPSFSKCSLNLHSFTKSKRPPSGCDIWQYALEICAAGSQGDSPTPLHPFSSTFQPLFWLWLFKMASRKKFAKAYLFWGRTEGRDTFLPIQPPNQLNDGVMNAERWEGVAGG